MYFLLIVVFCLVSGQIEDNSDPSTIKKVPPKFKAGIVTTVKSPGPAFDSWICYHLSIGFSKIYIFFDDPNDSDIQIASKYPKSQVHPGLEAKWEKLKVWNNFKFWIKTEVMARQNLNAEVAAQLAVSEKVKWLLHIDADELFYAPDYPDITHHFALLDQQGFDQAVYLNYEAVPTSIESTGDYFKSIKYFKRNQIMLNNDDLLRGYSEWLQEKFFYHIGYFTGKAAARVSKTLIPLEVTRWWHPKEKRANFDNPIILHYINPTYQETKRKFSILGNFDDTWFHRKYVPKGQEHKDLPLEGKVLKSHSYIRNIFQANQPCQGSIKPHQNSIPKPVEKLDETNRCDKSPNVFCFNKQNWNCCDMLYNSRQALNKKDNPRLGIKYTGNRIFGRKY